MCDRCASGLVLTPSWRGMLISFLSGRMDRREFEDAVGEVMSYARVHDMTPPACFHDLAEAIENLAPNTPDAELIVAAEVTLARLDADDAPDAPAAAQRALPAHLGVPRP